MEPIITISLSLEDARELQKAATTRLMIQDTLRREQGLEPVGPPSFLQRLEQVLGLSPGESEKQAQRLEDELWQHAWLSFTDEWAWHRAKQEVERELGKQALKRFSAEDLEKATEAQYKKRFETYLREVQLPGHEDGETCQWTSPERLNAKQKPSRTA